MGGMGGLGGYPGNAAVAKDAEGRDQVVSTVRHVGGKTFFRRQNGWVDSEVKPEEEARRSL